MRILTGLSGSLLVVALALAGCVSDGSGKDPESASTASGGDQDVAVDACGLLTTGELEAAFGGESFGDGELTHDDGTGADQCLWKSADDPGAKTFSVTVLRQDGLSGSLESSGMTLADLFAQTKTAYPNAKDLDLGDEAYAAVSEVQVLDGDTWYSLVAYLGADTDVLDGLKELATQVVG